MNIQSNKLPRLLPFNDVVLLVEGFEQKWFYNPITQQTANNIFDAILNASYTHNLKSIKRSTNSFDIITLTFVERDDEDGIELDPEDIELLAKWLGIIPPPTIDEIWEAVMK